MGGDESKPAEHPVPLNDEEGNYFYTEELNKVSFKHLRRVNYYWIDPKIYNAENQKYFNQFLSYFNIDSFTSL